MNELANLLSAIARYERMLAVTEQALEKAQAENEVLRQQVEAQGDPQDKGS